MVQAAHILKPLAADVSVPLRNLLVNTCEEVILFGQRVSVAKIHPFKGGVFAAIAGSTAAGYTNLNCYLVHLQSPDRSAYRNIQISR